MLTLDVEGTSPARNFLNFGFPRRAWEMTTLANGSFGTRLTRLVDDGAITQRMLLDQPLETLVDELYLMMLTRLPSAEERHRFVTLLSDGYEERIVPENQREPVLQPPRLPYVSWSNHLHSEANTIKTQIEERVRQGPAPTNRLREAWRVRAEDAVWALLNSPEMILIP